MAFVLPLTSAVVIHVSVHIQALEDLSLQYDSSVRNSENTVVQFVYGDDGLNPEKMENNERPVDFDRLRLHVSQSAPCRKEPTLTSQSLLRLVERKLSERRFQVLLPVGKPFLDEIMKYFSGLAEEQLDIAASSRHDELSPETLGVMTWNSCRMTETQVELLLSTALEKCKRAYVEPGEAVGAIGAQSISEPGTQMTLKVS